MYLLIDLYKLTPARWSLLPISCVTVVNKQLEENYMYAGVPARKIKYLGDKWRNTNNVMRSIFI